MSLSRAFTMRAKRSDASPAPPMPVRSGTVKNLTGREVTGTMISAPTFISTTNTLALSAPDVATVRALRSKSSSISSGSSASSADESDKSSMTSRSRDTQLTDASSVENSPTASPRIQSSDANFSRKMRLRSASSADLRTKSVLTKPSPEIPLRDPSHSKSAHEAVARKRSVASLSTHVSVQSRTSNASDIKEAVPRLNVDIPTTHPFGKELKQLDEIVEEFGTMKNMKQDIEGELMKKRNLACFCADDYIMDIRPLYLSCYGVAMPAYVPVDNGGGGWI